jgi:hypothetical protein
MPRLRVGYGWGTLHYFGLHATKPGYRCGVALDEGKGLNNGTVDGFWYFRCEPGHGLLVRVSVNTPMPGQKEEGGGGKGTEGDSFFLFVGLPMQCDPRKVKLNEPTATGPFIARVATSPVGILDAAPFLKGGKSIKQVQMEFLTERLREAATEFAAIPKKKEGGSFRRSSSLRAKNRYADILAYDDTR